MSRVIIVNTPGPQGPRGPGGIYEGSGPLTISGSVSATSSFWNITAGEFQVVDDPSKFTDDFFLFSGCKYETRKGQDVIIKAFKSICDKYADIKLVCNWTNTYTKDDGKDDLIKAGIPQDRVIMTPLHSNEMMAEIYQNTDLGIFPSRCEAGTNLVMMEYMACGKPCIGTIGTGQGDILNSENGLPLNSKGIIVLKSTEGEIISNWEEPDSDHLIELIKWSYENRKKIQMLGKNAAQTMKTKTWEKMAQKIFKLIS